MDMAETLIICDNCCCGIGSESPLVVCDEKDFGRDLSFCSIECLHEYFHVRRYEKAIDAKASEDLDWKR